MPEMFFVGFVKGGIVWKTIMPLADVYKSVTEMDIFCNAGCDFFAFTALKQMVI